MSGCPPFMKLGFEFDITFQKSCINGTFHAQVSNEIAFYAQYLLFEWKTIMNNLINYKQMY